MSFIYNLAATWNSGVTTFNGIKLNITNGAGGAPVYAAASLALSLQNNSSNVFAIDPTGRLGINTGAASLVSQFMIKYNGADVNILTLLDASSNISAQLTGGFGRLDLFGRKVNGDSSGGIVTVQFVDTLPLTIPTFIGHYAWVSLNDALEPNTMAYIGSNITDGVKAHMSSNMQFGIMNAVAGVTGVVEQPNFFCQFDSIGFRMLTATANFGWTGNASDAGILFGGGTEITRRASDGHLRLVSQNSLIELSNNICLGGSTVGANGVNVIGLTQGGVPTTSPPNTGQIYVLAGALQYRGAGGTVTSLAAA